MIVFQEYRVCAGTYFEFEDRNKDDDVLRENERMRFSGEDR